jgi:hypothetical protein
MNPAMIQVMVALLTATAQLLTELAKMRQQKQGPGRKS